MNILLRQVLLKYANGICPFAYQTMKNNNRVISHSYSYAYNLVAVNTTKNLVMILRYQERKTNSFMQEVFGLVQKSSLKVCLSKRRLELSLHTHF